MTEHRSPYVAQLDLLGGMAPPQGLDPQEKVAYLLEQYPDARNNDRELMLAYWSEFDGMREVLGQEGATRFAAWFRKATHPETIRRRRAEIQKLGGGGGSLLPSDGEAARRRALDGAGPPRGRR